MLLNAPRLREGQTQDEYEKIMDTMWLLNLRYVRLRRRSVAVQFIGVALGLGDEVEEGGQDEPDLADSGDDDSDDDTQEKKRGRKKGEKRKAAKNHRSPPSRNQKGNESFHFFIESY